MPSPQTVDPSEPMAILVEFQDQVQLIWDLLDRETILTDLNDWPGFNAISLREFIVPSQDPDAGPMPLGFAHFLSKDLRSFGLAYRTDRVAMYMSKSVMKSYHETWINLIHSFLVVYTNCSRPRSRGRGKTRIQCLFENIKGYDIYRDSDALEAQETDDQDIPSHSIPSTGSKTSSEQPPRSIVVGDLQKSIMAMTSLFPPDSRLTGEESEAFTAKLAPILDQMHALQIPNTHRPHILFSLTTSKARQAAAEASLVDASLEDLVSAIKSVCLYDVDKRDRRISRWNSITFAEFRSKCENEEHAARACIEFTLDHHKDLPTHISSPHLLLSRIKEIFRHLPWCETLYQRTVLHEDPTSFAQRLLSAASNEDIRRKKMTKPEAPGALSPYTVNHSGHQNAEVLSRESPASDFSLAAFFAKTPSPPRHKPPFRYQRRGQYRHRKPYNPGQRVPRVIRKSFRLCYGCRREGHILRNCPGKKYHIARLRNLSDMGQAANYLITHEEDEPDDQGIEVVNFLEAAEDSIDTASHPDFDHWVISLLDQYDNSQQHDMFHVKFSLGDLQQVWNDLVFHSSISIHRHALIDTGAPKTLATQDWLSHARWNPIKTVTLPDDIRPFRFAGHPITALHAACLIATIKDVQGRTYYLRLVTFVLPSTPVPFLIGLQDQRRLGFDVCLRQHNDSHLCVSAWNAPAHLAVTSHSWLAIELCNKDPNPKFDWSPLIHEAFNSSPNYSQHVNIVINDVGLTQAFSPAAPCDGIYTAVEDARSSYLEVVDITNPRALTSITDDRASHNAFPIPPWRKDSWKSHTTPAQVEKLHHSLRHPENSSLLKLYLQQMADERLSSALRKSILELECKECAQNAQLPRAPKLSIPPEPQPNVVVSLDVMSHDIKNRTIEVLVMLDSGDMMIRLAQLPDRSAMTAFYAYFSLWISYFDAPVFTVVDRGSNLTNETMASSLRKLQSQLCPIPTEAPWSLGANERSHRFLHKAIDKLICASDYEPGHAYDRLLSDIEMAWNFCHHSNNIIPHYYRFGTMPRILGELSDPPSVHHRVSLMEIARETTAQSRANELLRRALHPTQRNLVALKTFTIHQKVWFYRKRSGWRPGKLYPTHEQRVRPYFGEISLPPEILDNEEEFDLMDKPESPVLNGNPQQASPGMAYVSNTIRGTFTVSQQIEDKIIRFEIPQSSLTLYMKTGTPHIIDSNAVNLTHTRFIKSLKGLPEEQQSMFKQAKLEEITFLLSRAVSPLPYSQIPAACELQPLKWILAIKQSPSKDASSPPVKRYRARLVSASHRSRFRHSVHGNAPTASLSTLRVLYGIVPTWLQQSYDDPLTVFIRDVTKAYLQSQPTKRLVFYRPPPEFEEYFPEQKGQAWKARVQLYGDVEAGLYWHKTFVPWLIDNIPDLLQSIYDPSLLYSPTRNMAIALCTDDTCNVLPQSILPLEQKVTELFECRSRSQLPTDFKGLDISIQNGDVILSQNEYINLAIQEAPIIAKSEQTREMNAEELSGHRKVAGQLAWIAIGSSPLSAFCGFLARFF